MEERNRKTATIMNSTYLEHISEETLERFVLGRSTEEEVEGVETHLFACHECISHVERLEIEIAATRLALQEEAAERKPQKVEAREKSRSWFTMPQFAPRFAMAGALAMLALGVAIVPQWRQGHNAAETDMQISISRGADTTLPKDRALHLRLNNVDLADGAARATMVNQQGGEVWKSTATIKHNQAALSLPSIRQAGPYYLRLAEGDQDLEFALQVK